MLKIFTKPIIYISLVLLVGGCQSIQQSETQPSAEVATTTEFEIEPETNITPVESQLDPELLYDLLVASIASQRNEHQLALESLSRAAYQSRDRRLIAEAIQLAMEIEEFQQAVELAQLFYRLEPNNHLVVLSLARAQFKLGEKQIAYDLLTKLALEQKTFDTLILQDIATLLSRQNPDSILSEFLNFTYAHTDNAHINLIAALVAVRLKDLDEYLRLLNLTLEIKPDWEIPGILKLSELAKEDIEAATVFAEEFLEKYPDKERFKLQFAKILIQYEDIDGALAHLKEILEINPDSADTMYIIGVIYLEKDFDDEAKTFLSNYLELNPKHDQTRIFLADIEFERKNYTAAALHLHGVSSQRYYLNAQIKLARVIAERDGVDQGLNHLKQIDTIDSGENTRIILEQDLLLRDYDQLDRSRSILDEGLKQFPEHPDLLYNRGLLAAQMELLELHEQDMRKLIKIQPNNAHAYNALGYTLADKTNRLDEAMELISTANNLLPDNPFILDSMGWIHFRMGNNEEAIKFLRQALEVKQDAEIAAHLGEVLWISGNKVEAREVWDQGTIWSPENPVLLDTIQRFSDQQQSKNYNQLEIIAVPYKFLTTVQSQPTMMGSDHHI